MKPGDNDQLATPTISVMTYEQGLVVCCSGCQKILKAGKYALKYELGHFSFLIGEKELSICTSESCEAATQAPILFDEEGDASVVSRKVLADVHEGKGIPSFPFIEFASFPVPTTVQ